MTRRVRPLSPDELDRLPSPCATCTFWELDLLAAARADSAGASAAAAGAQAVKAAWLSTTLSTWGSCGQVMVVDDAVAGFVTYAPPHLVARSAAFPTSPVSADSVLLMALRVAPHLRGGGFGRVLLQSAAKDLSRRGVRAIEAFADGRPESEGVVTTSGADGVDPFNEADSRGSVVSGEQEAMRCLLPVGFLEELGFVVVRPHARYPRLRLDLRTTATWLEDVETALERLLGSITEPVLRPI